MFYCLLGVAALINLFALHLFFKSSPQKFSPLFLIPGDGGSKLYSKLNRTFKPYPFCESQTSDYYLLWVSPYDFLPIFDYCYHYNLRLRWIDSSPVNQTGVSVKTGPFGDPSSVEHLDDSYPISKFTGYFSSIISHLTSKSSALPYKRNENLFGIPFDFRMGLNDFGTLFEDLLTLIEQRFEISGIPVTLLAHSYGCLVTTHFLQSRPLLWREKYIKRFISVSGPYNGSIISLAGILVGVDFNVHLDESPIFRDTIRTFPSSFALLPTSGSPVWVEGVDYSLRDLDLIVKRLGGDVGDMLEMWEMYKDFLVGLRVPEDVELYCIYSRAVQTIDSFRYDTWEKFPSSPKIGYVDGDGTVRISSLRECGRKHPWAEVKEFSNTGHRDILHDPRVIEYMDIILTKP